MHNKNNFWRDKRMAMKEVKITKWICPNCGFSTSMRPENIGSCPACSGSGKKEIHKNQERKG